MGIDALFDPVGDQAFEGLCIPLIDEIELLNLRLVPR